MTTPTCPACTVFARLTTGAEIYPHRPDLHGKAIWICDGCGAYVGCHPNTIVPLGTPAGPELRVARMRLHNEMIDPLWKDAWRDPAYAVDRPLPSGKQAKRRSVKHKIGDIQRAARTRVYEYLAEQLGLTRDQCHTGLFDIETCRRAWIALRGVSYAEIRAWAHQRRTQAMPGEAA